MVSINLSATKGTTKAPVPHAQIDAHGLVDDAHAGDWDRQVSLLSVESIERFAEKAGRGFEHGAFAENVTTRGIDLDAVALLDRFRIGDVDLDVTQIGKACHGGTCAIYREVGRCLMPDEGVFCRVRTGGHLAPGDTIVHELRPLRILVITVSDRAHSGAYADRSGPHVRGIVEAFLSESRWHPEIDARLLPDDADQLRQTLAQARDDGIEVVMTTGGTGIGPRDVTPDVVLELADKEIPGIMEHIRVTCGAKNRNALLSRSVAAVLGQTLVFALPGSRRAVDEYLAEICPLLDHALCMVHGLGHG